ncbi:MAG: caspase family protein [Dyadobacter sp.]|uniref:caspase family protein n=1 Tax=Dyadobacter sp. TaxID=1914288 RepID=UPI0032661BA2
MGKASTFNHFATARKGLFLLLIFYLGFHLTIFGQDTTRSNTYAVVIGITKYQTKSLSTLQFADRDASLFAAHLRSKAGGNVPVEHIRLLLNEDATIAAIYDALNWLQEHCTSNDKAYFYFSGHGDVETDNNFSLGYLLAYNSPPNNYRNNAITIEDLNKVANHLSSKTKATVVLVTDACHSGKLAGDYYKGKQLVASQLQLILNNEIRMAACGVDEKAAESEDWGGGRGVFSYYLLMGLNGIADLNRNDTIQLRELNTYLDSAFKADQILIRNAYKQRPVLDGNPYQTMSVVDASTLETAVSETAGPNGTDQASSLLRMFKPLGIQPIDHLFGAMKARAIESKLSFARYIKVPKDSLPLRIVLDCMAYQLEADRKIDSLDANSAPIDTSYYLANGDTLLLLKNQLLQSQAIVNNFNERLIQMVHGLAQDMVNAYLDGDIAELEKRQYYYTGNRKYSDFIDMLRVVLRIAPKQHYLYNLLMVQEAYISGLAARLEMATSPNTATLLTRAMAYQQKAMKLEPYAAYIHNETGNLYLRSKKYALADYHFNMAEELSPTWAVPWSNQIRLGLATGQLKRAAKALAMADSLQHDLPYILMNAGLLLARQGNLLAAESYFQKAISKNNIHFLPYERLGNLYIATGDYEKADRFLAAAAMRKVDFAVNDQSFSFGIELGGPPGNDSLKTVDNMLSEHYVLAERYEGEGEAGKAMEEYATIIAIENDKQLDQAILKGFVTAPGTDQSPIFVDEALILRYETPVNMGGYIKLANLFEKAGDYVMAEKTYLQQIQRNREAGYLRGKQTQPGPFQLTSGVNFNFYWGTVNRQAEAATFSFYQRMLRMFPRNAEWQEKAGMFLYQRLLLCFRKLPVNKYVAAHEGIKEYAYPFLFSDVTGNSPEHQKIQFSLPGTDETIVIPAPKYDPLNESLQSLKLAMRLSGEVQPSKSLLEAIADLYSWMGNEKAAFETYKQILQNQQTDTALHNKIIQYCFAINESIFALSQLEILYKLGKTTTTQNMQLANGYALNGHPDKAMEVLSKTSTVTSTEKAASLMLHAKTNWLAGRNANALRYLHELPVVDSKTTNPDSVNALGFYTTGRLNALLKQNEKALHALKRSLESGFGYGNVLNTDPAWKQLRVSPQWKTLKKKYSSQLTAIDYQSSKEEKPSPLDYSIPD